MSAIIPYPTAVVAPRRTKPRRRNNNKPLTPSASAIAYRGPTRLPRAMQFNDLVTIQLNVANAVSSNGSGVINTVLDSNTQTQASTDWSSFAAIYTEYRTLSMDSEFIPWNKYNLPTTTSAAPVYSVVDRSDNSALTSLSITVNHDSVKGHEPSTRIRRIMKMNGTEEAIWTAVGSTNAANERMYVKLYSSGNANSTTYYDYLNRLMVQFRGRK